MLSIFYGRENINKDRAIYENIKGRTMILVPDQFTVQAERDAFFYMKKDALMDVEILSFSRLTDRIFSETGGGRMPMIDRQGRHMLLTKIMREMKKDLLVYGNYCSNPSFIDMANNFISEIKQYGKTPEDLEHLTEKIPENRYLHRKLKDIGLIYAGYEERIKGKYIDTEDKVSLMISKLASSQMIRETNFKIYGFDYFAPKNREIIGELIKLSPRVDLIMTWDDSGADKELFDITGNIIDEFKEIAADENIPFSCVKIGGEYAESRPATISAIEENLFALPQKKTEDTDGLTIVRAAGFYSEAETAAAKILELAREKEIRYRDIAVICNDLSGRGKIYKRVFAQYGIDLFVDEKRDIMDHPAVNYIVALTDIVAGAYRADDVIRLIKTGLTDLTDDRAEKLENYIKLYNIRGPRFREDFTKGVSELGEERICSLNESRKTVIDGITEFAGAYKQEDTVRGKVECLYGHLTEKCHLPEKIEDRIDELIGDGKPEQAGESAQIWNVIINVFDQMIEVTGDTNISQKDFAAMFRAGFEAVEIGLIPPAADGVMMGTMQRTRTGKIKVLLVMGANEGVLPAEGGDDGILSEDEKLELAGPDEEEMPICKLDKLRVREEDLSIYRNLAGPTEELWISCSVSDEEGNVIRPSRIYEAITEICPNVSVKNDIITEDDRKAMLSSPEIGMTHLTEALREGMATGEVDDWWKESLLWYRANEREAADRLERGLTFRNTVAPMSVETAAALYKRGEDLSLSPSRLEKFGKCPFEHFVSYGLRPDEPREYRSGPMDIGDIYHRCLKRAAEQLSSEGTEVTDPASPWMTVDRETCDEMTLKIAEDEAGKYREGLFGSSGEESYRAERIKKLCCDTVWMMIDHVRRGRIEAIEQEIGFGRNEKIPPLTVETESGTVFVEGTIDRVDYMPDDNVKVIDYKSGNDKYSEAEAVSGWKLQLFVYLKAACEGNKKPAGTFYFHIPKLEADVSEWDSGSVKEKVEGEIKKAFRMEGIATEEAADMIDDDIGRSSDVMPAGRKKDGKFNSRSKVLSVKAMDELVERVNDNMEDMCRRIAEGEIDIEPRRKKDMSACTYCSYKGICKFDITFDGCEYVDI